jgi:hypothetical protein
MMKKVLVLLTVLALSGCEPFPSDEPTVPTAAEQPTKTKETPAPSSFSPNANPSMDKKSDAAPSTSNTSSTTDEMAPTVKKVTPTSISTESVPVSKPEKPEPVVIEREEPDPVMVPNAGKLQIIGTSGKQVYYMKKVEQPDANCYVVSNSVTWDTSVSCVPAVNKPPVTTGK